MADMNHEMSANGFMPHGYCFLWQPGVLWLHVLSDLAIAIAYFGIPLALIYFIRKRRDLPFQRVFVLFGAFILLCGCTHLLSIWVLWHPNYIFEGWVKAATAVVSIATLVMVIRLMPQLLTLPSPAQLREVNTKLESMYRQSEENSRAVIDNVLDGVITIDEHDRIRSFNAACEDMFGYQASEVIGRPISLLMPDPTYTEHDRYVSEYLPIDAGARAVQARRKDGTGFSADLAVSAFEVDGKPHYTGIIRDITKAKQAEAARQKLLKRLTDSNTELERFAYVASHDMQEPLRMVLNFSQIIAHDYADKLDDDGREYLKIIGDSAGRMRDMVQDLLEYARLDKDSGRYGQVDLRVELAHVLENLRTLTKESQAVITYDPLPVICGNGVQLMRLMQNLIANAIKYQKPRRLPVVHVGCEDDGDYWRISVRDNGMGIEDAFIDQIFEPFRRLHSWEGIQGSGLGLSVCRKIVESHGGRIWAVSEPDTGSTFFFTIPKNPKSE
ncbi:ATP-binding protein [Asticcacaulis taihuensis]|uniref:sensor histidine kinase n=1 Tax=Asticcacaulis taihuensis TaxID=260084 RepID=UPI0026F34D5B|nr:ATP-binding protein [Asticcacaulis taihuensis]